MLPVGVSPLAAKPEQFRRVPVEAKDPLAARLHDDVTKAAAEAPGYEVLFTARPGEETDLEMRARARVQDEVFPLDRSKL